MVEGLGEVGSLASHTLIHRRWTDDGQFVFLPVLIGETAKKKKCLVNMNAFKGS